MLRIPTHRPPTHPGEMLLEEFLTPMRLTQRELADAIHVPYQRINELINGRRGKTHQRAYGASGLRQYCRWYGDPRCRRVLHGNLDRSRRHVVSVANTPGATNMGVKPLVTRLRNQM